MKTGNIKPFCIWLTGLSGSGKTSIAKSLQIQLERMGKITILIDGDEVRKSISSDLSFTAEDRKENAKRIAHIAKLIYQSNISSIVSTISPYKISREYARSIFPENSFIEVFINSSIEVCKKRDTKKLYEAASLGNLNNFTGIDMPYEVSDNFDIEINTLEINIDESVDKIMKHIYTNLIQIDMSTKKKRLIIHIGQPKTGSTALQYFFSKYHEELKKNNIDYPRPEGKNVLNTGSCVGNLVKIVYEERLYKQKIKITDSIIFRDIWKDDYVSLIKDITENSPCDTVIFSAEGISGLSKSAFEKMKGYLEDFFDVEFIIFMRDPYELFYSNWKQWLKVNFITDDFKTFTLEKFLSPSKFDLSNPFEVPDTANMKIINYDTYKHELVKTFLKVTQLHFEIPHDYQSSQLFNRSFTDSEAYLQLLINRQFKNTRFPFFFRMLLLKRDAHSRDHSIQFYDKEIHTLILNHLKPKLVSINKIIHGDPLSLEVKKINASASQSIEKEDVEVLVSALSMSKQTQNKKISLSQKMSHYYKCIRKKNIPFSFDPEAYLILNLDVKDRGMDPYDHFTQYGIYENRPYKYM